MKAMIKRMRIVCDDDDIVVSSVLTTFGASVSAASGMHSNADNGWLQRLPSQNILWLPFAGDNCNPDVQNTSTTAPPYVMIFDKPVIIKIKHVKSLTEKKLIPNNELKSGTLQPGLTQVGISLGTQESSKHMASGWAPTKVNLKENFTGRKKPIYNFPYLEHSLWINITLENCYPCI